MALIRERALIQPSKYEIKSVLRTEKEIKKREGKLLFSLLYFISSFKLNFHGDDFDSTLAETMKSGRGEANQN